MTTVVYGYNIDKFPVYLNQNQTNKMRPVLVYQVDAKPGTGQYVSYDTERYGTLPTAFTNGHAFVERTDDLGPLNR